jgi:hypothetical protein
MESEVRRVAPFGSKEGKGFGFLPSFDSGRGEDRLSCGEITKEEGLIRRIHGR